MHEYGIIGYPLSHSRSPEYFFQKFLKAGLHRHHYHIFPIKNILELHHVIKTHPFLYGLNVTSPYKQQVIPHLHRIDDSAAKIQAVNAIKIIHDQETTELVGYNTDALAFKKALTEKWGTHFSRALILGSGGAAAAAGFALDELQVPYKIASRQNKSDYLNYNDLTSSLLSSFDLIVNATPIGMFPFEKDTPPIPYPAIKKQHYLFDMIYNPVKTVFLQKGEEQGAKIENGERMFEIQAELSWNIFFNE